MEETTNAAEVQTGGSKKTLWIVLGVIAVVIVLGLVTGGGMRGTGLGSAYFPGAVPAGVDIDRNMDGTVTYNNEQGSVTVGQGASMPSNWPSDAPPAYSGATIVYSGTSNPQTGAIGSVVMYNTKASAQSVGEYYSARLKAEGWTIEGEANMGGTQVISAKKDTRTIGVYIADAGDGTVAVTAGVEL